MKLKTIYTCESCGYQTPKWAGKCPNCEKWDTLVEEVISLEREKKGLKAKPEKPISLAEETREFPRIETKIGELDRVLGGGIVAGSLILLGGEPGIGKSTLTLQICEKVAEVRPKILYVSGEESTHQLSLRAKRLNLIPENLKLLNETNFETILATLEAEKPDLAIIDSIQILNTEEFPGLAGGVSQVRFCAEGLMRFAKQNQISIILIGHVTKEGNIAGPRTLEHLVDVVLYLEGDRYQNFRILRGVKNRFGSTNEIGVFEMAEKGLLEVKNPSASFLSGREEGSIGSAVTVTIEGTRPFLVEVQALTNFTSFGYPRRTASGFEVNRLQLLIAVLQKHAGINLSNQDVYVNVVGGMKLEEPAVDLAVCLAIISSYRKQALPDDLVAIGEVGLSGEIRNVAQLEKRLKEVEKMGFKKAVLASKSKIKISFSSPLQILEFKNVSEIKDILK